MEQRGTEPPRLSIEQAVALIVDRRVRAPAARAVLVGISGIDGCGKGRVSAVIEAALHAIGANACTINVDGWLNLPEVRFGGADPARHFYTHALRLDELFRDLVVPLRDRRSHRLDADFVEETATRYRRHRYEFESVDVILLEGIYLLKRPYRRHFDLALWVDCSFATALERAIARGQEGLSRARTIRAYETIYFPAQRIHFERDRPRSAADAIIDNDPSPGRGGGRSAMRPGRRAAMIP